MSFFWGGGGGGEQHTNAIKQHFPDVYIVTSLRQKCRAVPEKNSMHFEDVR